MPICEGTSRNHHQFVTVSCIPITLFSLASAHFVCASCTYTHTHTRMHAHTHHTHAHTHTTHTHTHTTHTHTHTYTHTQCNSCCYSEWPLYICHLGAGVFRVLVNVIYFLLIYILQKVSSYVLHYTLVQY